MPLAKQAWTGAKIWGGADAERGTATQLKGAVGKPQAASCKKLR
jgi:hypothetical protein